MYVILGASFVFPGRQIFVIFTKKVESSETTVNSLKARHLTGILAQPDLKSVTLSMRYGRNCAFLSSLFEKQISSYLCPDHVDFEYFRTNIPVRSRAFTRVTAFGRFVRLGVNHEKPPLPRLKPILISRICCLLPNTVR